MFMHRVIPFPLRKNILNGSNAGIYNSDHVESIVLNMLRVVNCQVDPNFYFFGTIICDMGNL